MPFAVSRFLWLSKAWQPPICFWVPCFPLHFTQKNEDVQFSGFYLKRCLWGSSMKNQLLAHFYCSIAFYYVHILIFGGIFLMLYYYEQNAYENFSTCFYVLIWFYSLFVDIKDWISGYFGESKFNILFPTSWSHCSANPLFHFNYYCRY